MNPFEAGRRGYKHKNLLFWLATLRSLVTPLRSSDRVLDLGCGYGMFLQLLYEIQPFLSGIGVDFDQDSIKIARQRFSERNLDWPIQYFHTADAADMELAGTFDVIFANEILWFNDDLSSLASRTYQLAKPGGHCYFTMGSHPQNPLWEHRREKMKADGIESFSWTIDDVAKAFTNAGFAVGLRRLPIDGFFMYHREATTESAGSLYDLVKATTETKMLFYFGKHEPVEKPRTLRG